MGSFGGAISYERGTSVLRMEHTNVPRVLQGYLAHKKHHPPSNHHRSLARHRATVGSDGGAVSYERGTSVPVLGMEHTNDPRVLQGYLAHRKHPPPSDHHRSLGIGLL